jgi:hypothetical protein
MTCRVPQSAIPDIRAVMEKQILGYQQSDEAIKEWEGRDAGMLCSPAPYSTFTLRPASLDLKIEQRPKGKCHFKCMIPAVRESGGQIEGYECAHADIVFRTHTL